MIFLNVLFTISTTELLFFFKKYTCTIFFCNIDKLLPLSDEKIQLFNPPSLWNRTNPRIPLHLHLFKWRSTGCCRMLPGRHHHLALISLQREEIWGLHQSTINIFPQVLSYKYNIKLNHLRLIFVHIYICSLALWIYKMRILYEIFPKHICSLDFCFFLCFTGHPLPGINIIP